MQHLKERWCRGTDGSVLMVWELYMNMEYFNRQRNLKMGDWTLEVRYTHTGDPSTGLITNLHFIVRPLNIAAWHYRSWYVVSVY